MNKEQRAALKDRAEQLKANKATVAGAAVVQVAEGTAVPSEGGGVPAKGAAAKDDAEILTFACGHKIGIRHFKGQKCEGCRRAARLGGRHRAPKEAMQGRLPPGSRYVKLWTGEKWDCTLSVPGQPTLRASGGGSFGTEVLLDGQYRERLSTATAAPE